jgi:hypothetical protein
VVEPSDALEESFDRMFVSDVDTLGSAEGLPVANFPEWYVFVGLTFHQNRAHHRLTGLHQFLYSQPFHPHESLARFST